MAKVQINIPLGSNIVAAHNALPGLQGGTTTERYHLSLSQYNALPSIIDIEYGSGLRNDEGTIKLGAIYGSPVDGIITENTWLVRTENPVNGFTLDGFYDDIDHTNTIGRIYRNSEIVYGEEQGSAFRQSVGYLDNVLHYNTYMGIGTPSGISSIFIDTALSGMFVTDDNFSKGLEYTDNYSDNYTEYSIPHLGYIEELIANASSPAANQITRIQKGWQYIAGNWVLNTSNSNEKGDIFKAVALDVGTNRMFFYPYTRWNGTGDINDITNHSWDSRYNIVLPGEPT